jgi:enediyne biosynthesis protein E4
MPDVELEQKPTTATKHWRWRRALPVALFALGLLLGGWRLWEVRRYHRALAEINEQMAAGRNGLAARNLAALLEWRPRSDEAMYLMGACERARGRGDDAFLAWARVPPESPFWGRAIQGCAELKIERGRLDEAEQFVHAAQRKAPDLAVLLNPLLATIYSQQGRTGEARQLIEAQWDQLNQSGEGASEKAMNLVRLSMDLEWKPAPTQVNRDFLDQASKLAPDDDRVWLGQAALAIRDGSFELASQLLDRCLRQRPDDLAVWRSRLSLALASNQLAGALAALAHLPVDESGGVEIPKLAAWIARQRGDLDAEVRALELLIEADPGDLTALARITLLAQKAGDPEWVASLEKQKNEIARLQARYRKLYARNQPIRDAEEMARLALQLGRGFEARAFLSVAVARNPGRSDLREKLNRISRRPERATSPPRSLAKVLAPELGGAADQELPASSGQKSP